MTQPNQAGTAALSALIIIHLAMLFGLFSGVEPHPPVKLKLFAMSPFLSVVIAAAVSAMIMGPVSSRSGKVLAILASLLALVSFGPHKFFDPALPLIWPALVTVWVAIAALIFSILGESRSRN